MCHRGTIAGVIALALTAAPSDASGAVQGWERILFEDGITVSTREVPDRGFPTFRGLGVIHGNIYDVLAVISDIGRYPEWVENCKKARLLEKINEREYIVYQRIDVPWPVSDRDSVVRSIAVVDIGRMRVKIKFWAVKDRRMGKVEGVVRMENLRGQYLLTALGESKTRIDFEVDADPGGLLPTWLAKFATRRLPLRTIQRLRTQVKRTRGWYRQRIERWRAGRY